MASAIWGAHYLFTVGRTLDPSCFRPPPRVGSAVLSITRRREPLVGTSDLAAYEDMVRTCWERGSLRQAVPPRTLRRLGLAGARPTDLRPEDWARVLEAGAPSRASWTAGSPTHRGGR